MNDAVGVEGQAVPCRPVLVTSGDGQGVAVGVGVVGQHGAGGDRRRRVLGGGVGVVAGDRGVVDGGDGDGDGGGVGAAVAVGDGVGEAVGAVEVRRRGCR